MRLLAEEGPDAVTLPRIASAGHFTSGPLYRRYDTGPDVLLDLWNTELRSFFSRVVEASVRWMSEPDTTDTAWLTDSLHTPSTETKALIGVLAVARRLGAQGEEVRSETTTIHDTFVNRETTPDRRDTTYLGTSARCCTAATGEQPHRRGRAARNPSGY